MLALKSLNFWDAIVFTCHHGDDVSLYEDELTRLSRKDVWSSTRTMVVADAADGCGSGGSTINALLCLAESLTVARGETSLNDHVFDGLAVLIVHMGAKRPNDALPISMHRLPSHMTTVPLTPLTMAIRNMNRLRVHGDTGVWVSLTIVSLREPQVCGAEWLFVLSADTQPSPVSDVHMTAFTTNVSPEFASNHGVYIIDADGTVLDIEYCTPQFTDRPLVMPILHLPTSIASTLIGMHSVHPLSSSTYYGIDSGQEPIAVSLFFDILRAACADVEEERFLSGTGGLETRSGSVSRETVRTARRHVWECFGKSKVVVREMKCEMIDYLPYDVMDETRVKKIAQSVSKSNGNEELLKSNLEDKAVSVRDFVKRQREENVSALIAYVCHILRDNIDVNVTPFIRSIFIDDGYLNLLAELDKLLSTLPPYPARILYSIADTLATMSEGRAGLRSGPAHHADWWKAFGMITSSFTPEVGENVQSGSSTALEGYTELARVRQSWTATAEKQIRAARHYEAVAQLFIHKQPHLFANTTTSPKTHAAQNRKSVTCRSCVRIDIAGGWSDTPPITLNVNAAVINLAIRLNGERTIGARCTIDNEVNGISVIIRQSHNQDSAILNEYRFEDTQQLTAYSNPSAPGALIAAVIIGAGIVKIASVTGVSVADSLMDRYGVRGLVIEAWSAVPQGSGLGTSSILAGCIYTSLVTCLYDQQPTNSQIVHMVLFVEQLLTTGGGWQDQVGGNTGGLKIGRFHPTDGIVIDKLCVSDKLRATLNTRLVLVYTGKTRLAKNLLHEVIRQWYSREAHVINTVNQLIATAEKCASAFVNCTDETIEDCLHTMAECTTQYQRQKMSMAVGCQPVYVDRLFDELHERKLTMSAWLAGAGGGGFCNLLLERGCTADDVRKMIANSTHASTRNMRVYECSFDDDDMSVQIDEK